MLLLFTPGAIATDYWGSIGSFDITSIQFNDIEGRSGCCSWHDGVCGCDERTGRVICCDGTLSPSCTC